MKLILYIIPRIEYNYVKLVSNYTEKKAIKLRLVANLL